MAEKSKNVAEEPQQEFTVTLDEFLSEFPASNVERKASFTYEMKQEGYVGNRTRTEWNALYELHNTRPTNTPWATWIKSNGGN